MHSESETHKFISSILFSLPLFLLFITFQKALAIATICDITNAIAQQHQEDEDEDEDEDDEDDISNSKNSKVCYILNALTLALPLLLVACLLGFSRAISLSR